MNKAFKFSRNHLIVAAVGFAVIGTALLLRSFAAVSNISTEAESGTFAGPAERKSGNSTEVSGGEYVSFGSNPPQALTLSLTPFATNLNRPASIASDGSGKLFIGDLTGKIEVLNADGTSAGTFLDITNRVGSGGERGLLGLVFHPDYDSNRQFFVYYTQSNGDIVIARFTHNATDGMTADADSEVKLLTIGHQFATNHNGGGMFFGNDGLLYIATGDGGGNGPTSQDENSQDKNSLLGKILRLDVNQGAPYVPAAGNPFVGTDGADEIWALGFRNPWRVTYDAPTAQIFIADVGENAWEEVSVYKSDAASGANFGWGCFEGLVVRRSDAECAVTLSNYVEPVHVYNQSAGDCSVIGGYLYRGAQYPALVGQYVFGDFCSGRLATLAKKTDGSWGLLSSGSAPAGVKISSFGQATDGTILAASLENGTIYKVAAQ